MVRFGRCTVDVPTRSVEIDGVSRHLEPQAFDLLAYLIEHRDRVVPKTELLDEIWGDQFVSESALTTRIKEIRHALDDDGARQEVVRTARGHGYRFVATLGADDASTGLVGRDADLENVLALLDRASLVTLVGPGGVGKTTLAEAVAHRHGVRHREGVITVSLASIDDPASVVHLVRAASGLRDAVTDDALVDHLAALDAVVVIDNCEHVLAAVARLVAPIVAAGGPVRLLATSRERLGVHGEQVAPIAPLEPAAARQLLRDRARAVAPEYSWSDEHEPDVDRLLAILDRLPLAIEMAAPHLPTMGAGELADLLAGHVDVLRSSDPTASERHRTLDALVAWSEAHLDDEQQAAMTALTAFASAVTAADVAAVAETDVARLAVGPLAALVAKSLAVTDLADGHARYRLLETVKARAAHRRTADLTARHARYVVGELTTADRVLRSPDEATAVARIGGLAAEIRAAHAWARAHEPELAGEATAAMLSYGHERQCLEPVAWAHELSELPNVGEATALAALAALAADASNSGRYDEANSFGRRALGSDDPRVTGSVLDTLASTGLYVGDFETARRHGRTLVELGVEVDDPVAWSEGLLSTVLADVYAGRPDAARQTIADHPCPPSIERSMNPTSAAWQSYMRGELLAVDGDVPGAVAAYDEAIRDGTSVGSHFVSSVAAVSRLAVTAPLANDDAALAAFLPVLRQFRLADSLTHGVTTLRILVPVLARLGHDEAALTLLGAATSARVRPAYGLERDRLDAVRSDVVRRVGDDRAAAWYEHGAVHDPGWALGHAIAVVEGLRDGVVATGSSV